MVTVNPTLNFKNKKPHHSSRNPINQIQVRSKNLTLSSMTTLSLNWRNIDLMDGPLVHKDLARWLHSKSCGHVQETRCPGGDRWQAVFLRGCCWDWGCLTSLSAAQIVGLSAPSPSLLTTQSCVVQSTSWREGMPPRGTWTGFRGGTVRTSWS